ncbi:hypothetical protein quinque_007237 [Culex quinquefasciatus]
MELLSDEGLRLDGRRSNELRRIQCKLGVFSQPDGSAYVEQGNTKVLAAVYGPHQAPAKKSNHEECVVNCQYSMATFSTGERKKRPRGDRKSQEMTIHLQQALSAAIKTDLYPKSQIDVYIEVLMADGGNYCASVNAATLALIDAGICLKEYVCACTASLAGKVPLMDVSNLEEMSGGPTLTRFHLDHLPNVLETALQGCREVQKIIDQAVRDHVTQLGQAGDWGTVAK